MTTTTEHKIYTGNHLVGNKSVPFARCTCGAYLVGEDEIEQHREGSK